MMRRSTATATVIVVGRALLREGIASHLHNTSYKILRTAARPDELEYLRLPTTRPVVAIVGVDDKAEPWMAACESIRLLRSSLPNAKIVIVAETNEPVARQSVALLAADACIVNPRSLDILPKTLDLALLDQQVFVFETQRVNTPTSAQGGGFRNGAVALATSNGHGAGRAATTLSQRERQVLIWLARGQSNKAIARLCQITEATVKVHLKSIMRKTNTRNRVQAAIWTIEHGLRDTALADDSPVIADAPNLLPVAAGLSGKPEIADNKSLSADSPRVNGPLLYRGIAESRQAADPLLRPAYRVLASDSLDPTLAKPQKTKTKATRMPRSARTFFVSKLS